jgi:glc operon protein GlcG
MTLRFVRRAAVAALLALGLGAALDAQLTTKKALTLEAAKKIAAGAAAEAQKNNWKVAIAIVDDGGNLVYLERLDGTQIASIDIAQFKARSSIGFKRSTKEHGDALIGGASYLLKVPWLAPFDGGRPLVVDGEFIGAIGVSGLTAAQDGVVAAAGVAILATMK